MKPLRHVAPMLALAALGACAPPTLIQPPPTVEVRPHETRVIPLTAYVSLELRNFHVLGGGPLHTREVLAPPRGVQLARDIIRQTIESVGLFQAVEALEGPPPAADVMLLQGVLDVTVSTPAYGITSFTPRLALTGIHLDPGGARQTLFANVPYETTGIAQDNLFALGDLVTLVWRSGATAIASKIANDLPRRVASSPAGAQLLGVTPPVASASAPAPRPSEPGVTRPAVVPASPYRSSWALVIGVNVYQHVAPNLNYAVADAYAMAAALPGLGFPQQNIRILVDGQATKARIETVLYKEFAGIGPDDRLLVYFAGHGETLQIRGGEEGYLLPTDADPQALPLTAIAMDDVKRIGQRLRARHVFFAVDACFSGFALTRDVITTRVTDEYLAAALREPAVQVLTAGRKGERAIEDGGHGLFTRRLLDGLRGLADTDGRGMITASQLAAWIEPRVVRDSGGKMTPQYGRLDGEGQFVFLLPRRE